MNNQQLLISLLYSYLGYTQVTFESGRVPEDALIKKFNKAFSKMDIEQALEYLEDNGLVNWVSGQSGFRLYFICKT